MDSGDGVELELNKGSVQKDPETVGFGSHINKENKKVENGADVIHVDSGSEGASKTEVLDSSTGKDEVSILATENKASIPSEKGGSNAKGQIKKIQKGRDSLKGSTDESQKTRTVLSQSVSFPTRGSLSNGLQKSTKTTGQPRVVSSIANAANAHKTSVNPEDTVKTTTVGATAFGNCTEAEPSNYSTITIMPLENMLPLDKDHNASSIASNSTQHARNSTGCLFNFRLDERAEKRKEFFMKLEEKNHAKELEKTDLQEKSKESQQAEIRQLRKSLNFKATPMPSFYQEPSPPKLELKKIPPTRARSPKLGRRKQSVTAEDGPAEAGQSSEIPRLPSSSARLNEGATSSKGNAVASMNLKNKSLSELPSAKSRTTKSYKLKSLDTDNKASKLKFKTKQVVGSTNVEPEDLSAETSAEVEAASLHDRVKEVWTIANHHEAEEVGLHDAQEQI